MEEIAILLKSLNIYAHNAHNLANRLVFMQDHEFLAEIYTTADGNYDNVIERMLGLGNQPDLNKINLAAAQNSASMPPGDNNSQKLQQCLLLEKAICAKIEALIKGGTVSVGTEQMLGNIADLSEVRQYKLQQRLKQ